MTRSPERAAALKLIALYRAFVRIGKRNGHNTSQLIDSYTDIYLKLVKPFPRRDANQ